MKPPCEVVVKEVLPAIRATLVLELTERHHLSQTEVARRLGITQPAVSQYLRMLRGVGLQGTVLKKIKTDTKKLADEIAGGELKHEQLIGSYCAICQSMSKNEILCLLHVRAAPALKGGCRACLPRDRPR